MIHSTTNKLIMKRKIIYYVLTIFITALTVRSTDAQTIQRKTETNKTIKETKAMQNQNFTTTFLVDKTPEEVFNAINNVSSWWSGEIIGNTDKLNDVFIYHFEDIHSCKVKILEMVPDKKVVWLILENDFNFTKDKTEWVNTKVVFDIGSQGDKTSLTFTHIGLVPSYECYETCHQGWTHYIQNSLKKYIDTGKGEPNMTGSPQTEAEKKLSSSKL